MTQQKKIKGLDTGPFLCLINPKSGHGRGERLYQSWTKGVHDPSFFVRSTSSEHALEVTRAAVESGVERIIAVGGDGTVSKIGAALCDGPAALGMVPIGSGNGIARHFGISLDPEKAFEQALCGSPKAVDTLRVNQQIALGWVGFGFDAAVAQAFDQRKTRGFGSYIRIALKMANQYQPGTYHVDGETKTCFSMVAANTSQFGNEAYMNPGAIADDGAFEWLEVPPVAPLQMTDLAARLFLKTLPSHPAVTRSSKKQVRVKCPEHCVIQLDGEVLTDPSEVDISINPKSLSIIVP